MSLLDYSKSVPKIRLKTDIYVPGSSWKHITTGSVLTFKLINEKGELEFEELPEGHGFIPGFMELVAKPARARKTKENKA